jgi:hypothetical protein
MQVRLHSTSFEITLCLTVTQIEEGQVQPIGGPGQGISSPPFTDRCLTCRLQCQVRLTTVLRQPPQHSSNSIVYRRTTPARKYLCGYTILHLI